ncbi:uncharacterized protein BP5553_08126 [Venustampulla echinocandica]|uniref:DUF7907 domain-containing protein n=1 Tax=Venustampulla echinocandica TaxID=2656787 RepID=A0A370TFT3_9HELO|nr:uncharacterized protein BP5553_08126 [Venustampulla echinocandica]RDL33758.1 hypothetical protein BP5553_08126 [Venustampulla echinocandica]
MFFKAATIALLSTMAASSPTPTTSPKYPERLSSENFRLVADVKSNDLNPSIQNYVLTSYHTGAGLAFAVLQPNETATSGRIFYANGTDEDIRYGHGNVLSDEGTPLFPGGIVVNPPFPTPTPGSNPEDAEIDLSINAGVGTSGVGITRFPDQISNLYSSAGEGFYACMKDLMYGPAVLVFVKQHFVDTPKECADVVLLPQCSEGSGAEHPFGKPSSCYADVAGTDWTVYHR